MKTYYYVDIPTEEGPWEHTGTFDSKEAALAYCKRKYGADNKGRVSLISWSDEDDDDESKS